jgi:hypothetical protein
VRPNNGECPLGQPQDSSPGLEPGEFAFEEVGAGMAESSHSRILIWPHQGLY